MEQIIHITDNTNINNYNIQVLIIPLKYMLTRLNDYISSSDTEIQPEVMPKMKTGIKMLINGNHLVLLSLVFIVWGADVDAL